MKLDIFFSAVRNALEQAFLLAEVDLIKDYSNHCLILKLTKVKEENDNLLGVGHSNDFYDTEIGGYYSDDSNGEIEKKLELNSPKTDMVIKTENTERFINIRSKDNFSSLPLRSCSVLLEKPHETNKDSSSCYMKSSQYPAMLERKVETDEVDLSKTVREKPNHLSSGNMFSIRNNIDKLASDIEEEKNENIYTIKHSDDLTIHHASNRILAQKKKVLKSELALNKTEKIAKNVKKDKQLYKTRMNTKPTRNIHRSRYVNLRSIREEIQNLASSSNKNQNDSDAARPTKLQDAKNAMAQKKENLLKQISKLGKHGCLSCSFRSSTKELLQVHMKTHESAKIFQCSICNVKLKYNASLIIHMRIHTGEKPFKCDGCNYECRDASKLKQHKLKHSEKNIYFCKHCDYGAKYKHSVQNHEKVMHAYSGSLFQCSLCDFKTLHDHRRVAHIKAHEENVHFDCNVCGKILFDERDFKYHLRKHKAEPRKKNIVCAKCDKKFCSSEQLKAHMFLHTGKKEYKCRLCGLEYRGFKNMKKHFVKQHPNEKIFYCEPCSFSTDNLRENNRHASTAKHVEKIS